MGLNETTGSEEEALRREADATFTPIDGTIELLPLCNMNCKMCYVRMSQEEMNAQGRMLTCDEWLPVVEAACKKGLLFLLFTGGEPLIYPEFKRLYSEVSRMGVIIDINTNGTLIDEEWVNFFCENGIRRLNITLYGKDDDTYERVCNYPNGFTQVMKGAALLKERGIPFRFNCTLTPDNVDQLSALHEIANSFDVSLSPAVYMFPGIRKGKTPQEQYRLSEEEAARTLVYGSSSTLNSEEARETLEKLHLPAKLKSNTGLPCHAGRSGFWINWKGDFLPCGMFREPGKSILEYSFDECWDYIVSASAKLLQCADCIECDKQNICQVCPAVCYAETGSTACRPDYMCKMTENMVLLLNAIAEEEMHSA